ncbi:MAG TPA: ABC transporter ATP-binding protein [Candidatus Acidoferrales bacterium]|nr:ABC transporter ATP-binding protein [Candidatus Acidoferrales bacterium]
MAGETKKRALDQYWRLLHYARPYLWPHTVLAIVCMLVFSATSGAVPFIVRTTIDDVFVRKDRVTLFYLPLVVIGVFVVRGLANFGQAYCTDYVGLRIIADLRSAVNRRLQFLPLGFFNNHPTGTLIARMNSDVALARSALMDSIVSLSRDITSMVALVIVAFVQDWLLALIACVVFPASVLPIMRFSRSIKRFTRRGQITTGRLTTILQESIQGNRIVKAFGMEAYEIQKFDGENERLFRQSLRASRVKALVAPCMELLAALGIGAVLWYGGYSVIGETRTQGQFMAFLTAMFLMYQPFKGVSRTVSVLQQGMVGAERVFEILDADSEIRELPGAPALAPITREIEFHNVSFGYGRRLVLYNVNLRIRVGEVVALVGTSGVGKSTLADLIPRFYDVTAGKITIDGTDIRAVSLASLRAQIGLVSQHTFLFDDTVRNNIAYGTPEKSLEEVIAAAKAAHAHDFIMEMPRGYDTMIGELGMRLSGGQRQRIAIARALLKNAPILILDEATSSLDPDSERLVQAALENLIARRTVLLIAHRLSTIRSATRIAVLVGGTIVEEGTHEELLARDSEYSRLYSLQLLEEGGGGGKLLH